MPVGDEAAAAAAMQEPTVPTGPLTPPEPGSPMQNAGTGSFSATGASPEPAAPSMSELLQYLKMQNERMNAMMELMTHDRKGPDKRQLDNCKPDERYFCNVGKYSNLKSGWKEWRRQFLNAVRECDVDWADMVEALEKLEEPICNLKDYTPVQNQLSTNLYNRLIAYTTGVAFQIVESVPNHNGGEAWGFFRSSLTLRPMHA